jgi:hypothetical protein
MGTIQQVLQPAGTHQSPTPETHQSPALPPRVSNTIATQSPVPEHRVFSIYSPTVTFTSDSKATDILMRQRDSHILQNYTSYIDAAARLGFDVANFQQIYPIAHGKLPLPHTTILLMAFVFNDNDLHSNLFGVSLLTEHGLSVTYTNDDLQITTPTPHGPKTILYGVKETGDNVWRFSLPKTRPSAAHNVIQHKQHAELTLYASATFGSSTFKTFPKALTKGWLSNYPTLTAKILSWNQPHSPATALGHITASRSALGPPNQRPRPRPSESVPRHQAHQDHCFQRTIPWPQPELTLNVHQQPNLS